MKVNTNQQKQKRSQFINPQKTSFVPISPKNDLNQKYVPNRFRLYSQYTSQIHDANQIIKNKNVQEQGFINIFADDYSPNKQSSQRQNYPNNQNLGINVKDLLNLCKNVSQSQNTNDPIYIPPNYLNDKKMIFTTKSTTNLTKPNEQLLIIKTDNSIEDDEQEDTQQNKQLIAEIKEAEVLNQKIKQQNIQLRLKKLQSNAQPLNLLTLKLQIQQLKRKIQKIRNQTFKTEQTFNEYFTLKKNNSNKEYIPGIIFPQKTKAHQLERTASNLQYQNPYYMSTPYPQQYQQLSIQNNQGFYQQTILKSRVSQKQRTSKASTIPQQDISINFYQNYNNQKLPPDQTRIYIRK